MGSGGLLHFWGTSPVIKWKYSSPLSPLAHDLNSIFHYIVINLQFGTLRLRLVRVRRLLADKPQLASNVSYETTGLESALCACMCDVHAEWVCQLALFALAVLPDRGFPCPVALYSRVWQQKTAHNVLFMLISPFLDCFINYNWSKVLSGVYQ